VESLHDPLIPAALKLMIGDRFKIVFIETDERVRISRAAKELGIPYDQAAIVVTEKDFIKKRRGAETVRSIADWIIDNSSEGVEESLATFSSLLGLQR
jgi:hypothetical protein